MVRHKQIEMEKQCRELADKKFALEYNVEGHQTTSTFTKPGADDDNNDSDSESSDSSTDG